MLQGMYTVKAGRITEYRGEECRDHPEELECITNSDGAFQIFWRWTTSVQNIEDKFWMEVRDHYGTLYDISKGCPDIMGPGQNLVKSSDCIYNKDVNYMKDRVKTLIL